MIENGSFKKSSFSTGGSCVEVAQVFVRGDGP